MTDYSSRPNKREAYKRLIENCEQYLDNNFIYITLGHIELLDVIDIARLTDIDRIIKVISYEKDLEIHLKSLKSTTSTLLGSKVKNIHGVFPEEIENYIPVGDIQKVIFHDLTGYFDNRESDTLKNRLIDGTFNINDIYFITSCIAKRNINNLIPLIRRICKINSYKKFLNMNDDYLLKFFVEFFINNSINEFNKYCLEVGDIQRMITPIIFSKYKYNDLRMDMGLYGIFFQRFNCTSIEIDRKPMANINHSNPKNLTIKNKLHELRKLTKIHQN